MNISGISSGTPVIYPLENTEPPSSVSTNSDVASKKPNTASTVQISGKALLYSRIFRTTDLSKELHIETEVGTTKSLGISRYAYLLKEDRELLSSIYAYASENNIDLQHVDIFVDELADFRQWGWVPVGDMYTVEGRKVTVDFNADDKEIAERIKKSEEFSSTLIDKGFLDQMLDSRRPVHAVKFEFLEHLVSVFSESGAPQSAADKFATYDSKLNTWVTHISDEVDPRFVPKEPDLISINGGPYFRNPKKEVLSNEDFLKSIDADHVSQYLSMLLDATFPKSRMPKVVADTNQWIAAIYQGVKKKMGG